MSERSRSNDAGFTLIEMLVTVMIVGVAFAVIVGGFYTAVVTTDHHRKQASVQAGLRNVAEALKAQSYVNCATTSSYAGAAEPVRTTASAATSGTTHTAPSVTPSQANAQLLLFYALANGATFTPPTGTTERWDVTSSGGTATNRVSAELAGQPLVTKTATGTKSATSTASGSSVSQSVLLESSSGIALRAVSVAAPAAPTSLAITKPAGTLYGDAMIAQIAVRGGTNTAITAPAGWSLISLADNGTAVRSAVYQRTASGSATSYTWTFNPTAEAVGGIASYSGVNDVVASVDAVKYWNGTSYVTTCGTDAGLQLISLTVAATTKRDTQSVDLVKRRP